MQLVYRDQDTGATRVPADNTLRIKVFRDVTPCRWVGCAWRCEGT